MTAPPEVPAELLAAIDAGWERWEELQEDGCELHFELNARGRLRAELRDLEGEILRPLSPSEALAVAVPDRLVSP